MLTPCWRAALELVEPPASSAAAIAVIGKLIAARRCGEPDAFARCDELGGDGSELDASRWSTWRTIGELAARVSLSARSSASSAPKTKQRRSARCRSAPVPRLRR